jgi:excisionase family DNA binding protein
MSGIVPTLLALREVADCCRVSPHTVRKWVREGKLHPVRLCRRLLFEPEELSRFLTSARDGFTTSGVVALPERPE